MLSTDGSGTFAQCCHEEVHDAELKLSLRSIPELGRALSREELSSISLIDVLENDFRPSFVVDITSSFPGEGPLEPVYMNAALVVAPALLARLRGDDAVQAMHPHVAFKQWLWDRTDILDLAIKGTGHLFADFFWWATTVGHYKYVSGLPAAFVCQEGVDHNNWNGNRHADPQEHEERGRLPLDGLEQLPANILDTPTEELSFNPSPQASTFGPFDYTRDPPCPNMSNHINYFRSIDWAKTALGPMPSWPPELRCIVNMIMDDCHRAVLFWGDEATIIYNEPYIELLGSLHPCMGKSANTTVKDDWLRLETIIQQVKSTRKTISCSDVPMPLNRHGFIEEAYFSIQYIPILDNGGHVAGYYQSFVETTNGKLLERRISSLVEIGSRTAKARDLDAYWDLVISAISTNDHDTQFAALYAAENLSTSGMSSVTSTGSSNTTEDFVLKGTFGVDADHLFAPKTLDLKSGSSIFQSYLVQATKDMKPVVVHLSDLQFEHSLLEDIDWKEFGVPPRSMVICPIQPTTGEQVQGLLILGLHPRRPFDEEYKQYVHVMFRLLATSLASVVLLDEEIRQRENVIDQATRIQEQLAAQLQLKEAKFQRYADQSETAIFVLDPSGVFTYRNQSWYDVFSSVKDCGDDAMTGWAQVVWPEDVPRFEELFTKLMVEKSPINFELRTSMPWTPPMSGSDPDSEPRECYKWILCSCYPESDADNEVLEIVGNVTDISKQKWAETVQKRRTESALESKRHLENFLDTTSHEMRNPLSAIMQCADGIVTSYSGTDPDSPPLSPTSYATLLDQTIDAAQTIVQCAQHMKRVVDDILTVSKLDSGLLSITPIDVQPETVTRHAVKMFESEAKVGEVELGFEVDESYSKLGINWVSLDPTRLLQILINIITNALKFTRFEQHPRHVGVKLSACEADPSCSPGSIQFEPKLLEDDANLIDDWKQGPTVYLQFSVSDTGRGLSEDERSTLFARFSQASPRTHVRYGGSGLGLFISRRLTEMQGGAIGLASEYKKGSTFTFYIKARKAGSTRVRRDSLPHVFPEDIRHRATTHREISELRDRAKSSVSDGTSVALGIPPQLRTSHSDGEEKSTTGASNLRPPLPQRHYSALHPSIRSTAMGLSPEPDLNESKATEIPEELHVLVVEDNLVNQKVLAKQLRNLGCIVSVANHGGEALDFLRTTSHWRDGTDTQVSQSDIDQPHGNGDKLPTELNLILMDWEMPVMNGLTAVAKIRRFERAGQMSGHIPIIGVTANVRAQQIQTAMDVGMDDVVSKPFRVPELMSRMRRVVADAGSGDARWRGRRARGREVA
ncbi:hypothetical protein BU23DRAFT_544183 [Bimuria novae-zelandiae CBS 107.79]|uniref:Uncharacterized protein n=1 Tax=Bimuria novae-zelandiae CBS 107.79 TaxID=1447943 RepID=A0A6A5UP70_9PLEO|nr:hypothetical protein BU23DRAFT_544183 [Bimuria novae-zelandiae CBS 107.79]